jgi:hypothetical protein
VLKEAIGEEIGTGHADVFYIQTQVGRVSIGESSINWGFFFVYNYGH